jgi:hypothetical protein
LISHVFTKNNDIPSQFSRRKDRYDEARSVFSDLVYKNLDWPEAIWDARTSFEHQHGSLAELDACLDTVERAQYQVNMRRAKVSVLLEFGLNMVVDWSDAG